MITNDLGTVWPPEEIAEQIRENRQMKDLYEGEHEKVFGLRSSDKRVYITANLLGALTNLLSWRLFGEKFFVTMPDDTGGNQEFIDYLISRNQLQDKLLTAAAKQSYSGKCYFKVRYDADLQRIVISPVDSNRVMPEYSETDNEKIVSQTIWQVLKDKDGHYVWFEHHYIAEDGMSYIANLLYKATESNGELHFDKSEDRVALQAHKVTENLPDEQATGITRLLVCGIDTDSDYKGLLAIQEEINNRLTQRSKTLDIHAQPILFGPMLMDENGRVTLNGHTFIETPSTDSAPVGAIVWDANMSAVKDAIAEMRELFAATAGIEMSAIIAQDGSGPQSGRAIKLSQMRTQARVQAKQVIFEPLMKELFATALKLAMVQGVILSFKPAAALQPMDVEDLTITFSDGLPNDSMDAIEEQTKRLEFGVQSLRDAIKILDDCSDEEADIKVSQIQAEAAGTLHSSTSLTATGSPSFLSLTQPAGNGQ